VTQGLDRIIDAEWPYFVENCDTPQRLDFYGMQSLIMRTAAESGEAILRFRPRLAKDNLRVPLQLQILEADFLDQTKTMGTVNGHIMQGVEFDLLGRRSAYWLYTYHPGGVLILNPRGGILSQPIPAEQVLHTYRVLRPGQVRGIPWLHPVMMALRDLDDYADAERVRKKIEACVVAMVTQPEGIDGSTLGIQGKDPLTRNPVESFQPGMTAYLKPGEDVKFNNPPVAGGYREYKMTELQGIAAGLGIPYEMRAGDLSLVNYSSWRGGQLGFRNTIEGYRWLTLIPMFCMPVRRRVIDTLVLLGKVPAKAVTDPKINLYGTQWTAPRFESVDPVKDAEAALKDIRIGRVTWFEAVVANGFDPNAQIEQIASVQQADGQVRDHPRLRSAQHDSSRPGAARRDRGTNADEQSRPGRAEARESVGQALRRGPRNDQGTARGRREQPRAMGFPHADVPHLITRRNL
jgi:lambda family phage portal protein